MNLVIVEATDFHAEWVGTFARDADRDELWASHRATPEECIAKGMSASSMCWAAEADGEPICVGGVFPISLLSGLGCPWMVGTPGIDAFARAFVRASRPVIDACAERYPRMLNFVDDRNVKAHRWLERLGFTLFPPAPMGPDSLPFRRFQRGEF